MLVLSRKLNEKIVFPGIQAAVQVVAVKPGVVRLGIQAPPDVTVLREEVHHRQGQWQVPQPPVPVNDGRAAMKDLVTKRLAIAAKGFDLLRDQLHLGQMDDAEAILNELQDDLLLLARRFDGAPQAPKKPARSCKALLVEDDPNERELLASFLRMSGVDVDTAGDGSDALDYLRGHKQPDVVLMDMGMPRCDGPTAIREIRRNRALSGLKIYAVSGHSPEEFNISNGPAGVDRWFHKPIDPAMLVRNLNAELTTASYPAS